MAINMVPPDVGYALGGRYRQHEVPTRYYGASLLGAGVTLKEWVWSWSFYMTPVTSRFSVRHDKWRYRKGTTLIIVVEPIT